MFRPRILPGLLFLLALFAPACQAQLGKNVLIPAGSVQDRQLKAINDATDPAQKLTLMEQFAKANAGWGFRDRCGRTTRELLHWRQAVRQGIRIR